MTTKPIYGQRQAKMCLRACAKCTDSDLSRACAKMQSLIQAVALHCNALLYPRILFVDSECPDQTARMRRLIRAFAVRICPKTRFRMARPTVHVSYTLHTLLLMRLSIYKIQTDKQTNPRMVTRRWLHDKAT